MIGRNQNPWSECNLTKMKEDDVHLARRTTGGGAVFHDLGNTNFTFLSPRESYRRENNIQIILAALKQFGIRGEASGRNDLLVPFVDGPRKFSGSAYREKKDRAFHHGTLLLNADLSRLGNYLTPNPKKLQAKGKESVRARVANLNELKPGIHHEEVVSEVQKSFEDFYDSKAEVELLNMASLQKIPELNEQFQQLSSWNWLYGNTLEFNQKMDEYLSLGFFEFHFNVEEGLIAELKIYTDCLYPHLVEELTQALRGKSFSSQGIQLAQTQIADSFLDIREGLQELMLWLTRQVEI